MATVNVTENSFAETAQRSGIVLIDFWAEWCGPCRRFAPIFEEASERHPDVFFGKVDTEANPALASAFQIMSIPTLMILRDGVLLGAQPGALPAEGIDDVIRQVNALDMDEVRKQIAEARQQAEVPSPS
jgi:thioredoxin